MDESSLEFSSRVPLELVVRTRSELHASAVKVIQCLNARKVQKETLTTEIIRDYVRIIAELGEATREYYGKAQAYGTRIAELEQRIAQLKREREYPR